jgi:hypothetical protein
MKLKIFSCWLIQLCWILPVHLQAQQQQFSDWSVYPNLKTFKARYYQFKATDGYNYIKLEVTSYVPCTMQITSTLCNNDNKERNGWKNLSLKTNEHKIVYFKVLNSCTNGWWWWYRSYKDLTVHYDY